MHKSLLLACATASLCFSGLAADAISAQDSRPTGVAEAAQAVQTEVLELKAKDGQRVPGWFRGTTALASPMLDDKRASTLRAKTPGVVLLHMYRSDHTAWEPILDDFEKAGIATLSIDMRGHGSNTKGPDGEDLAKRAADRDPALFNAMWMDALAAVKWLGDEGFAPANMGMLGASVGCSVAIDAARRTDGLTKVAVLTPGLAYLGVDTVDHLKQWGRRNLLIVTSAEEAPGGPALLRDQLERAFKKTKKKHPDMAPRTAYWEVERKGIHGTRMFGKVSDIESDLVGWFAKQFQAKPAKKRGADSRPAKR